MKVEASHDMQIKGIRLKISQAMKKKRSLGQRLKQLRKSKLRTKKSVDKQRYLDRIRTLVVQSTQLTKRCKALRQQLNKLTQTGNSMATKLKSNSANKVKTVPKGSLVFVAKQKLNVEDDTHVSDISKGEVFYLQHIVGKGFFLFDVDEDSDEIHKFKITGKVFKDLQKNNTPSGQVLQHKKPKATGEGPVYKKPRNNGAFNPIKLMASSIQGLGLGLDVNLFGDHLLVSGNKTLFNAFNTVANSAEFKEALVESDLQEFVKPQMKGSKFEAIYELNITDPKSNSFTRLSKVDGASGKVPVNAVREFKAIRNVINVASNANGVITLQCRNSESASRLVNDRNFLEVIVSYNLKHEDPEGTNINVYSGSLEPKGGFTKDNSARHGGGKVASITANYADIRKMFGKSISADKSPVHYTFVSASGYVFSVYSWKMRPSTARPFEFMVGAGSYNEKELRAFAKLIGGKLKRDQYK